jgi:hypothetical protein
LVRILITFIVHVLSTISVELTHFTVKKTNQNTVLVEWQTASERRNHHFVIERSTDSIHFETLDKPKGHPLSTKPLSYSFEDKNPTTGVNYYRLSQVDDDGKTTVFGIRSAHFAPIKSAVKVVPNPSKTGRVQFQVQNFDKKTGKIIVVNTLGQVVFNESISAYNVSANLPTGVYIVQLLDGTTVLNVQKFVVE